ncbi:MAG: ATP-binding protein [Verrucomicrobiia bacterium]
MKNWFKTQLTDEYREQQMQRLMFVETNIMLPIKVVAIFVANYFCRLILSGWETDLNVTTEATHLYYTLLKVCIVGNVFFWGLLLSARFGWLRQGLLWSSAWFLAMLDGLFLSSLVYFTGGVQSVLYWLYIGLMIRGAVNFPTFWPQTLLNLSLCVFYTLTVMLSEDTLLFFGDQLYWMRLTILVLVGLCCWGAYALIDRRHLREARQREFQLRTEKIAATARLSAEMAHQLKNPLGIINNAVFLLQREVENGKSPPRETVQVIRDEVARADRIVTELMDYARLNEGRLESVDINKVLENALRQVLPPMLESKVRVVTHLAKYLPPLVVQRPQLEECFLNVLKNAVEAMPAGGTLTVQSRYVVGGQIEVQIADTGRGIAPDVLSRIFDAFTTTKPGGTGLGLAIVKNVAETYGGTVVARSELGKGSVFTLTLPVRTRQPR